METQLRINIPPVLRKPLTFGDIEQIAALKRLEMEAEEQARWEAEDDGLPVKKWLVDVSHTVTETTYVNATTKERAKEKALEEFKGSDDHDEIEIVGVRTMGLGIWKAF